MKFFNIILIFSFAITLLSCSLFSPVDVEPYTFSYDGKNYEVIKENMTWANAATEAVNKGGYLVEINSEAEQTAIFNELSNNANISNRKTKAPDGGRSPYVWIGGNDLTTEGTWVWNGNNDSDETPFWEGKTADDGGLPINDLYNNWGNEPDDFKSNQDGLGLALADWPRGESGQWNDIDASNELYFVIEYD